MPGTDAVRDENLELVANTSANNTPTQARPSMLIVRCKIFSTQAVSGLVG